MCEGIDYDQDSITLTPAQGERTVFYFFDFVVGVFCDSLRQVGMASLSDYR